MIRCNFDQESVSGSGEKWDRAGFQATLCARDKEDESVLVPSLKPTNYRGDSIGRLLISWITVY